MAYYAPMVRRHMLFFFFLAPTHTKNTSNTFRKLYWVSTIIFISAMFFFFCCLCSCTIWCYLIWNLVRCLVRYLLFNCLLRLLFSNAFFFLFIFFKQKSKPVAVAWKIVKYCSRFIQFLETLKRKKDSALQNMLKI